MKKEETKISVHFSLDCKLSPDEGYIIHFVSVLKSTYNPTPHLDSSQQKPRHYIIYHCYKTMEELIDLVIMLAGEGYEMEHLETGKEKLPSSWKNRHSQKDSASFKTIYIKEKNIHSINMIYINAEDKQKLKKGREKPNLIINSKMELITFNIPKDCHEKIRQRKRYIKVPKILVASMKATLLKKRCMIIEDQ